MRTQNYSRKRQAIYEFLLSTKEHPSAEWIYNVLKSEYPDLSLGTVYRNLKLLEDNGAVKSVAVVDGRERYDALMSPHSHFVCSKCGRVIDVFLKNEISDMAENLKINGANKIDSFSLIYYGVCDKCFLNT